MKHANHKTLFSLAVLIPSTLNSHFNMHFGHYVCLNKKSLWECAHCWVSLLIMTAQSAAVFYWLLLIRSVIIHGYKIRINMQHGSLPEKYCFSPFTKSECSKWHIQSIFVCALNPVKHGSTLWLLKTRRLLDLEPALLSDNLDCVLLSNKHLLHLGM